MLKRRGFTSISIQDFSRLDEAPHLTNAMFFPLSQFKCSFLLLPPDTPETMCSQPPRLPQPIKWMYRINLHSRNVGGMGWMLRWQPWVNLYHCPLQEPATRVGLGSWVLCSSELPVGLVVRDCQRDELS